MKKTLIIAILISMIFSACSKQVNSEVEVYANDFETNDLSGISHGVIETYNNSKVLGRYNVGGFDVQLNNLPKHKLIRITFDLYIHDSWDGNKLGIDGVDGPDIWSMKVDGNLYIYTTFSNAPCNDAYFCPPQSYPFNYPNNSQNPRWGSFDRSLPGVCQAAGVKGGTTLYKITKTIEHQDASLLFQCRGELKQSNTADPKCDESWSVDNIQIKVIEL